MPRRRHPGSEYGRQVPCKRALTPPPAHSQPAHSLKEPSNGMERNFSPSHTPRRSHAFATRPLFSQPRRFLPVPHTGNSQPLYLHSQSEAFSETTGRVRVPLVYARPEPFSHTLAAASCVPRPSCGKPKGKDSSSLIFTPSTSRRPGALQTHRWLNE